jgi:hypothetical protein
MRKENKLNVESFFDINIEDRSVNCRIYEENGNDFSIVNGEDFYSEKAICIDFNNSIGGNNTIYFTQSVFEGLLDKEIYEQIILDKTEFIRFEDNKVFLKTSVIKPSNLNNLGILFYSLDYIGEPFSFSINPITFENIK